MQDKKKQADETKVHINHEPYTSPNPTTGASLYALGNIDPLRELFREENGNEEDTVVTNDETQIYLSQGEHFYSEQIFNIIVNGQRKTVTKNCYFIMKLLLWHSRPSQISTIL